jgi:isocitrate lyase
VGDCSQVASLQREWAGDRRWAGVQREHSAADVIRLRGLPAADHALARRGARRLWELLGRGDAVLAGGAVTGEQAAALVRAGLPVIYLPGRPAAADGSLAPQAVRRVNDAMLFADQVSWPEPSAGGGAPGQRLVAPVVADAEAGLSGAPGAFALMSAMIEAGAAGVCFEDRLSSRKERGHLGGKVLVPTGQHIKTLSAARLAADVLNVPSLVMARTYAHESPLLTSDADERDHEFLTGERTAEGFHVVQPGRYARVTRALAFAPYADLLWLETATPNLAEARAFADIIYSQYPHQLLAYSCSPAFDWARLDGASIDKFRGELAAMGYLFQYTAPADSRDKAQSAVLVG